MQDIKYLMLVFILGGLVTFAERALPFVAGEWLRKRSWVKLVGEFLPLSVMVLLVVHSAAGNAASRGGGLPLAEAAAIALTIILQWFLKSSLVSIFAGTALYVVIVNGMLPF